MDFLILRLPFYCYFAIVFVLKIENVLGIQHAEKGKIKIFTCLATFHVQLGIYSRMYESPPAPQNPQPR